MIEEMDIRLDEFIDEVIDEVLPEEIISNPLTHLGTELKLAKCECPQTTGSVDFNSATSCRFINIPVRISNLCPNKEFILFVTVHDSMRNKIGQICSVFSSPANNSCTTPYVHHVRLAIKKPVCSTDSIFVVVEGNYTGVCNL